MRVLILLFGLLALTACSQKSAKVKLELTSSFVFGGTAAMQAVSEGGLMVWGLSANGESFGRVLNNSNAIDLELPNGSWTFSAVAWDNATSVVFDGATIRCARSAAVELKGGDVAVPLSLTAPACASVEFHGAASQIRTDLNLRLCKTAAAVTGITDVCTYDKQVANRVSDKAPAMSVLVRLEEYDRFSSVAESRGSGLSRCVAMPDTANGEWSVPGDLNLPVGNPAAPQTAPFRTSFQLYHGSTDCGSTGSADFTTVALPNGLSSNVANHKYFGNSTEQYVYLNVPDVLICNGRESLDPFAGGTGSEGFPYLICSAKQLYNMHDSAAYLNASFALLADIDLNSYTKGLANVADRPAEAAACWSVGQTWQPLGSTYAGCTRTINAFTGSIYGGNHRITGMRMRLEDENGVGFIGQWDPTSYKTITDLTFVKAQVAGLAGVGGVVGDRPSTATPPIADISYIKMISPDIEAADTPGVAADVGGVIGFAGYVNLSNISIKDGRVEGRKQFIGGVFGRYDQGEKLDNIQATGLVTNLTGENYVGGIGGRVVSNSIAAGMHSITHEGAIVATGQHIGGLFGGVQSSNALSDFYAITAIKSYRDNNGSVGGIVGETAITGAILRGYFAGHLADDCTSTCNRGFITGSSAASVGGSSDLYFFNSNQPSRVGQGEDIGVMAPLSSANNDTLGLYTLAGTPNLNSGLWQHIAGDLPRILAQNHPCTNASGSLSFSAQIALGRGALSNPLMICRKEQFGDLSVLAANSGTNYHVKITGAVNLTGTFTPPTIPVNVTLYGTNALLFGYHRVASASGVQNWAPFATNNGTMKDVRLANNNLQMTSADTGGSTVTGMVDTNNGLIVGARLIGSIIRQDEAPGTNRASAIGLVRLNSASGRIRDFEVKASLRGEGQLHGAFYENFGIVEDGVVANLMDTMLSPNSVSNVVGIGYRNYGTVRRISVESRFDHPNEAVSISFGVRFNQGAASVLEDIEVTSEAYWNVGSFGLNVAQMASLNQGTVRRTLMSGRLYSTDTGDSTVSSPLVRTGQPIFQDAGTSSGLVTAVPAGRAVVFGTDSSFTCSVNDAVLIPGLTTGDFLENSGAYWETQPAPDTANDLVSASRHLWVVSEDGLGNTEVSRVVGSFDDGSNITLTFDRACADAIPAGSSSVRIVQSFADGTVNMVGNLGAAPFNGVIYAQDLDVKADLVTSLTSPWRNQILDESIAADLDLLVGYYLAILRGETPVAPGVWSFEDNGELGLINPNK